MEKILVVDDDPVYARLIVEWLKDEYQPFAVKSGEQALRFLSKRAVDLILLDYEMPDMSGAQTLEAIRENPDIARIPVLFLSGAVDEASLEEIQALKTSGLIPKTSSRDDVLGKVKEIWSKQENDS